ncbi:MAG: hypothetical protein HQK63_14225 [Desulfamplus sp.]|nr:hypothetical protein [Desulfamplus sp.]
MQYDNQTSYAKHRGISQVRVSQLIRDSKIPKSCLKIISGRQMINRIKADEALQNNLNPIYVQKEMAKRVKKTKQDKKDTILETCRQALRRTEAKEIVDGVDRFEDAPFLPLLSYILNLFELNPELVKQELSEDEEDVILTFPQIGEIDQSEYWTTILSIRHLDNN